MKIKEAMHQGAEWVGHDSSVTEIARLMQENDIGAVPVGRADKLIGMVTDRDIALRVAAAGKDASKTRADEIMTKGIIYCTTKEDVDDAVHLMDQKKIRRLPVLDDKKRMVGMLSLGDIAHSVGRELSGELLHAVAEHHNGRPPSKDSAKAQPAVAED